MFDEGIRRLDEIYTRALAAGLLAPDPSLIVPEPEIIEEIEEAAPPTEAEPLVPSGPLPPSTPLGAMQTYTLQVETPDPDAVSRAELGVSRVRGVTSAITTSLALGGTSTMRVTFMGDPAAFQAALEAQGWRVSGSGTSLRISR